MGEIRGDSCLSFFWLTFSLPVPPFSFFGMTHVNYGLADQDLDHHRPMRCTSPDRTRQEEGNQAILPATIY